jgi:tetratricopeptide (TPR) repeat protein
MTSSVIPFPLRNVLLTLSSVLVFSLTAAPTYAAKSSSNVLDTPEDAELLGDYLAGSYAGYLDDTLARSKYFTKAFKVAPDDTRLGRRAVTAALMAGDFELSKKLAKDLYKIDKTESMAQAILAIDAFSKGRHRNVKKYVNKDSADITMGIVMAFTEGWNYVALGDEEKAQGIFEGQKTRAYFRELGVLQIAKMAAYSKDDETAKAFFDKFEKPEQARVETTLSKARFYAKLGEKDKAQSILEDYIAESGLESGPLSSYVRKLKEGKDIDKPLSPKQQLSRALTDPSYEFFLRNRAPDAAEVYLRLALQVDPKNEKAQLWLASLLENTDRSDEAMPIYKAIKESSPYVVSARLSEANIYFDREEDEKALLVLEDVNAKNETFITREALGRARLIRENYADALPIYTAIIDSMSEEEISKNTQPLYFRGISYERTDQWQKAEADFLRVLEIEPENADALNYLGYTWVDRGENLKRAFDMIRKAVKLEPDSGAIIDSLGWAHYKLGEYQEAKVQLEKAVELSPSSATIVDHLGDVYWKLGRYREAGYQWERALIYDPTDEERETIKVKLKSGLSAVSPAP